MARKKKNVTQLEAAASTHAASNINERDFWELRNNMATVSCPVSDFPTACLQLGLSSEPMFKRVEQINGSPLIPNL